MRKLRLTAITAALAVAPIAASAQGQAFLTVSAGQSHYSQHVNGGNYGDPGDYGFIYRSSTDDKDTAFGITGGYRWLIDDVFSIGPEAGFVDLGETTSRASLELPGISRESARGSVKNKAALLGVNAKWMLGHAWWIGARAGFTHVWIRAKSELEGENYEPPYAGSFATSSKYSSHDNGYYGAVSVGYDFNRHTALSLGYEHYRNNYHAFGGGDFDTPSVRQNIGVWSASFEYRF